MGEIVRHPNELYPLMKLLVIAKRAEKETPSQPHLRFCYLMLRKISRSFSLVIQQLPLQLRDAVCVFYLVLRALDTVEDDTSIATQVKVPILIAFHRHIYDHEWHFSCGINAYKDLIDQFHHVSSAFLGLGKNYQEVIEDITMRMGEGMAKFVNKEIETIDDYEEYCHYVAGLAGLGLSKLFHASGKEDLAPDSLPNAVGLFLQKTNIIRDYLEDINEVPKCRMYWPRQIWSKYVYKLEDLKLEENSVKAVQCLNDMVTNALSHVEDCLVCLSTLRDPAIFRSCAIPQFLFSQTWVTRKEYLVFGENIRMMECVELVYGEWIRVLVMAIGTLAMCYNNIKVFRGVVKIRRGLSAKVFDQTRTMADVYNAFSHFSCILKSKVDNNDPNATITLKRIEAIMRTCSDSGTLYKRNKPNYISTLAVVFFVIAAILLPYLSAKRT